MRKFTQISKFAMFGALLLTATGCFGPGDDPTSSPSGTTSPTSSPSEPTNPTSNPSSDPTSSPTSSPTDPTSGSKEHGTADLHLWHNFGSEYSGDLNESLIDPLLQKDDIDVKATSKGSYDKLKEAISGSISTVDYPNIATGYPDHFADYARSGYIPGEADTGILVNLNKYLDDEALNEAHRQKTGYTFRQDFYEEFMIENNTIAYDTSDHSLTVGLPFNKSTEVLGYNGIFVDYAKTIYSDLKVPSTWQEWKDLGPKFRDVQLKLNGKKLYGTQTEEGTASNFSFEKTDSNKELLDFTEAKDEETAVLSWDSMANMFITLVRQFGAEFTSYTTADRHASKIEDQHGYMEFYSGVNRSKTVAAMQLVRDLAGTTNEDRIFATPAFFGSGYASDAFAKNQVMFTICSTGGLGYNINPGKQRFRVAPIPYKDASLKYVISQGANMTIFDRGNIDNRAQYNKQQTLDLAFETIIKMTTGDYQAKWATETGYYPASRSATESAIYQEFINIETPDYEDAVATAYRESAQLNQREYMSRAKKWTKFVDPGFVGSATIRLKADNIVGAVINNIGIKSIEDILEDVYKDPQLTKFVRG